MPRVRITEDSLWYDKTYRRGEIVEVEGAQYLDLLTAGRLEQPDGKAPSRPSLRPSGDVEDRHEGELVFVLGNGPSLLLIRGHESSLENFTTIGVNRSFLMLRTSYLLFLDGSFWAMKSKEILRCGIPVFCPKRLRLGSFRQFGRYRSRDRHDVLSERWEDGLYWSRSSAVPAVNLAYLFGASQIALLGVDLNDNSHFYSKQGSGQPFLHADRILEDLWRISRSLAEKDVKTWNCSPDSAVRGFEKIGLAELLARGSKNKPRR